ncbi:yippee zinc-binding/DNA-binding /Mis18, centromere assembly-domain-containing protein [Podospora fimiseda]|uniref:Yippee zinc-binding/DNA-binding /Mis18, centromere assembly-domain-containing protein n=1 Tax=Podospora fimiseda TaxID=252190 RepID=A0AAN6YMK1_9PEZI|nr:yippee zinc-binding/DNA-binding /Mis18, centromere assembly-domain-containing protein [Podospora fimiseda]
MNFLTDLISLRTPPVSPPSSPSTRPPILPSYLLPSPSSFSHRNQPPSPSSLQTLFRCLSCQTDISFHSQIISKNFHGRHGRAYLVLAPLKNIWLGPNESRHLSTGLHVVADIYCYICDERLGWKYIDATNAEQKYKIGNFILETRRIAVVREEGNKVKEEKEDEDEEIVFDSGDEDECDDIFAGVWDPEVVKKRRKEKEEEKKKKEIIKKKGKV